MPEGSRLKLEAWMRRLELKYIQLALEIAEYEKSRDVGSVHENYEEMDRIEQDIDRAREGIALCRKHFEQT